MRGSLALVACTLILGGCDPSGDGQSGVSDASPSTTDAADNPAAASAQSGFAVTTVRVTYNVQGPGPMRGTSTLWIEDSGARAGIREELAPGSAAPTRVDTFWDGARTHIRNGTQPVAHSGFRPISTEASSMVRASEVERAATGWTAEGERTVAGQACSVWRNERMGGIELCVWRGVDLQTTGGGQRREAIEVVEGERIPAEIVALAN